MMQKFWAYTQWILWVRTCFHHLSFNFQEGAIPCKTLLRTAKKPSYSKSKTKWLKSYCWWPGAWQFSYREKAVKDLGIDCVVEGEAENVIGKIFKAASEGEEIPRHYEVGIGETPL